MYTELPRLLTLLRREKGQSQKDAAGALGVSQALLSHYEKGVRRPGLEFVVKAAGYYGVTTDYLLGVTSQRGRLRRPSQSPSRTTAGRLPSPPRSKVHDKRRQRPLRTDGG